MEKVYKTMQRTGACSIAVGIVILVVGLAAGICSIISGAVLLHRKKDIVF